MHSYKVIKVIIIFVILVFMIILTFIFPIKFCLESLPIDIKSDFFVIKYHDLENLWVLVGDKTGLFDENTVSDYPIDIVGKDPRNIISGDLYYGERNTYIVIYGSSFENRNEFKVDNSETILVEKAYLINSTGWDILGVIDSRNSFRMKYYKNYLTIYDYKWFDEFRKFFGEFSEY